MTSLREAYSDGIDDKDDMSSYPDIEFCATDGFVCPRCGDRCLCTNCTSKRGEAYEGPRRSDSKPKDLSDTRKPKRKGETTPTSDRRRKVLPASLLLQIPIALPRMSDGLLSFNGIPLGYVTVDEDGHAVIRHADPGDVC